MKSSYITVSSQAFRDFPHGFPVPSGVIISHAIHNDCTGEVYLGIIGDELPDITEIKPGELTLECTPRLVNHRTLDNGYKIGRASCRERV